MEIDHVPFQSFRFLRMMFADRTTLSVLRAPGKSIAVASLALMLQACEGDRAKEQAGAATSIQSSSAGVEMTSKPPTDPNVSTTLDVSLGDPSNVSPGATAAALAIGQRISSCWRSPEAPEAPAVRLLLTLAEDGSVTAVETLDKQRFASEPAYRAAAATATRAVFKCSPFSLAAGEYADWKSLAINLTPRRL